ncbi:MAG: hypothetical protein DWH82_05965 [Planctomycetota bacterium]|nr:MAG: hypothetical protein DWH82_05965 [Planctomycetota bacterium]
MDIGRLIPGADTSGSQVWSTGGKKEMENQAGWAKSPESAPGWQVWTEQVPQKVARREAARTIRWKPHGGCQPGRKFLRVEGETMNDEPINNFWRRIA